MIIFAVSHESVEGEEEGREHSQQIGNSPLAAIHVDRVEYLSAHRELTLERQHQQVLNNILHRRLAEYYKYVFYLNLLYAFSNFKMLSFMYSSAVCESYIQFLDSNEI